MSLKSRRKGQHFEYEVVGLLQDRGVAAEKISRTGYTGADISCPVRGADRKIECKRRARQFATIDAMLGANYALVCRDDRSRPLVVMTLDTFADLAK